MTLHERLEELGTETRGRIRRVLGKGNEKLLELDEALARVARDDWTVPGMRRHLGELRARALDLRANALKRVSDMPGAAVSRLATGGRARVQSLARGLAKVARRFEPPPPRAVGASKPPVAKAS